MKQYLLAGLLLLGGSVWAAAEVPSAGTRAIWIDVPFVQQTTDGCGSASLSMVMRYWDRKEGRAIAADAEATKIQAALYSPAAKGIFASSMRDYLERSGYQAFAFHGQWSDFEHQLALGRPMIVGLQASGAHGAAALCGGGGSGSREELSFHERPGAAEDAANFSGRVRAGVAWHRQLDAAGRTEIFSIPDATCALILFLLLLHRGTCGMGAGDDRRAQHSEQ